MVDQLKQASNSQKKLSESEVLPGARMPVHADIAQMLDVEPAPRDYVLPSLPLGKVGFLSGWGGTSKSFWLLQAAFQVIARGYCDFGLGLDAELDKNPAPGQVLYYTYEEDVEDLHHRVAAVWKHYKDKSDESSAWIRDIATAGALKHYPLAGQNFVLFDEFGEPTLNFSFLKQQISENTGTRLVILDPFVQLHYAEESDNGAMTKVLKHITDLAHELRVSIILAHHENKASQGNSDAGDSAIRGASALQNNARWTARMRVMSKAEARERGFTDVDQEDVARKSWVRMELEKTSYGASQPGQWLQRCDGGVLTAGEPEGEKPKGGVVPFVRNNNQGVTQNGYDK